MGAAPVALGVWHACQGRPGVLEGLRLGPFGVAGTGCQHTAIVADPQGTACRQGARGPPVGDQFGRGAVSGDATGGQHIVRKMVGEVAGCRRVVHRSVTSHVEQGGGSGPAGADDDEVGGDGPAVAEDDLVHPALALDLDDVLTGPDVQRRHDLDAGGLQVGYGGLTLGVGGQDHGLGAGLDGPQVDQAADGTRQHDAGGVVAGEDIRALDESGGHDETGRPGLDEAFRSDLVRPLHHCDPVVVVAPGHRGVGEDLDARMGLDGRHQFGDRRQVVGTAPAQVSAEFRLVFDEHDRGTRLGGGDRRSHAGRAAPRHEHVRVGVALVVGAVGAGLPMDAATGGELAEDLLVHVVPEPPWAHEGLVVEARGQEAADHLVGGTQVELQAGPHVLGADLHSDDQAAAAGPHVGLVTDLHEQVRVPVVGGHDAPPALVLHGAGKDLDTVGGEGRGDCVALVPRVFLSVPGERQGSTPVNHLAGPFRESVVGHDASESRISLVTVFRSMVKYRRQPLRQYQVSVTQPAGFSRRYR